MVDPFNVQQVNRRGTSFQFSFYIMLAARGLRFIGCNKREQRPLSLYVTQRRLPQILLELVIVRHDSIAHQPAGKTGFKLSFGLPLLLLLLAKESPEGLEFALLSPVCWEINKAKKINK